MKYLNEVQQNELSLITGGSCNCRCCIEYFYTNSKQDPSQGCFRQIEAGPVEDTKVCSSLCLENGWHLVKCATN